MSGYAQLLDGFMTAILADNVAAADFLREKPGFPARDQLAVYRRAYRTRLAEALENTYPASAYYLGVHTFRELADSFIAAHPSRHFNLDKYTLGFADYALRECGDEFARELALLEGAMHAVYQEEESPALDAGWAQSPEMLGAAPLALRAASRLLAFSYPVNAYFSAWREGRRPGKPKKEKSRLLVLRHRHQVKRLALEEAEYAMLSLLAEGLALGQALDAPRMEPYLQDKHFAASLMRWFARWVSEGVFRQPS